MESPSDSAIALSRHGLVDYQKAWESQKAIHQEVADGIRPNTLLLLEHPSVFTAGRRTEDSERPTDGTPVIDVDRGGRITWHGPGQLVGFVREIEAGLIAVCNDLGIDGKRIDGRSGVWIQDSQGDRKIAAIGVRVAQGVTMHGFALNVNPDLSSFSTIVPCGITDADVTSVEIELQKSITIDDVTPLVERHIFESLKRVSI
jgi:lipoyl(octanoyl) transferase